MIEGALRIIAELLFIQTARWLLRTFGIRLPEWLELVLGISLWLVVGALLVGLLARRAAGLW